MMENLLYTPCDLGLICVDEDLPISEEYEILNKFWLQEKAFIASEFGENKELFFKQIRAWKYLWTYYNEDKFSEEDIWPFSSEEDYGEYFDFYFKQLRYRLLFGNLSVIIVDLKTLLSVFETEEPSLPIIREIENRLFFYHLSFCRKGKGSSALQNFELNENIMIRLL